MRSSRKTILSQEENTRRMENRRVAEGRIARGIMDAVILVQ